MGGWDTALRDFQCNLKFLFCFTNKYKAIQENLAVDHANLEIERMMPITRDSHDFLLKS